LERSSRSGAGQGAVAPRGGPARSPLWQVAPNGHFEDATIGASLGFKNLLTKLIFQQSFYYILIFYKYFKNMK